MTEEDIISFKDSHRSNPMAADICNLACAVIRGTNIDAYKMGRSGPITEESIIAFKDSNRDLGLEMADICNLACKSFHMTEKGSAMNYLKLIQKRAMKKLGEAEEGTFRGDVQSDTPFVALTRNTFSLPLADAGLSAQTMAKVESLKYGGHTGIGTGPQLGWILWKDISGIVGEPAVLIEQLQSDLSPLISQMEFSTKGSGMEDPAVRELKQLRQKFPAIIGQAFESKAAGKKLFMTSPEKIAELTGLASSGGPGHTIAYKELAKILKMHPSTKLPGYLER
jgi:hypothetical protein